MIDDSWAAGICSYYRTSWVNNLVSGNTTLYGGTMLALGGDNTLANGQSANDFTGNTFTGNTLINGADDYPRSTTLPGSAAGQG